VTGKTVAQRRAGRVRQVRRSRHDVFAGVCCGGRVGVRRRSRRRRSRLPADGSEPGRRRTSCAVGYSRRINGDVANWTSVSEAMRTRTRTRTREHISWGGVRYSYSLRQNSSMISAERRPHRYRPENLLSKPTHDRSPSIAGEMSGRKSALRQFRMTATRVRPAWASWCITWTPSVSSAPPPKAG
jgi:hypothetical protein